MIAHVHHWAPGNFLERTVRGFRDAAEHAVYNEEIASRRGWLQSLDPRAKVFGFLALILAVALSHSLAVMAALLVAATLCTLWSGLPFSALCAKVWASALFFSVPIAVPALFLTPGTPFYKFPALEWPITEQGLRTAASLLLRVETTATLTLLLVLTTSWTRVLKALRVVGVPRVMVVLLSMTVRYIFLMLETAQNMFESRRSRLVGKLEGVESRRLVAGVAGVLLSRTMDLSGEVYLAMQARGFRGEVYVLDDFQMRLRDWIAVGAFGAASVIAFWLGR